MLARPLALGCLDFQRYRPAVGVLWAAEIWLLRHDADQLDARQGRAGEAVQELVATHEGALALGWRIRDRVRRDKVHFFIVFAD
jgi:hypothetical protein